MQKHPFVSIVVATYNSSSTVLETLNSIKDQTYKNIELIITDDSSTDNTISIVRNWLKDNEKSFINTKLLINNVNYGPSKNFNHGIKVSKGQWVKIIGGDDILLPECLNEYCNYIINTDNVSFIFSKIRKFKVINNKKIYYPENISYNNDAKKKFQFDTKKQYQMLLRENFCYAPTVFIEKEAIKKLNFFDESIPMIEDYPLWLKATKNGYKLHYLDKILVLYRKSESSSNSISHFYKISFLKEVSNLKKKMIYPNIPKYHLIYYYDEKIESLCQSIIIKLLKNKKNKKTKFIWLIFFFLSIKNWKIILYKMKELIKNQR